MIKNIKGRINVKKNKRIKDIIQKTVYYDVGLLIYRKHICSYQRTAINSENKTKNKKFFVVLPI